MIFNRKILLTREPADRSVGVRPYLLVLLLGAVSALALAQGEGLLPRVTELTVTGNDRASTVSLRHLADVRAGDSLLTVNLDSVVAGVARHPWVASANVRRGFPDRLDIEVQEHQTAMLVMLRGLYRVSEDGTVFARARSSGLDVPVLTGLDPDLADEGPAAARGVIRQALHTLSLLEETGALSQDKISEIAFDKDLGFSLVLRNGSRVHFGYQNPALQSGRLADLQAAGLDISRPHEVDLDLDGLAVATPLAI